MASLGDMVVRILGDVSDFDKKIGDAEKKMKSVGENMAKIGKGLTTYVTLPILGLGAAALKASSDMENLEASFTTMLGSADKAKALLSDLTKLASVTPFSTKDLATASQTLLQFGVNAKDILPTIKNLGDVSGGNADRFKALSLAFGQTASAGRLMGQDLLQMVNAGFNPLQEISKTTGISMADLKKQMEAGAISAEMVADSFKRASSEGGQFFGGMERGSKTLSGQISTLLDELAQLGREFGEILLPIAKNLTAGLTDMVRKFQSLTDENKAFILAVGLVAASIGPMILGLVKLAQAVTIVDGAMKVLAANPALVTTFVTVGPIVAGIAAIAAAVLALGAAFNATAKNQALLQNTLNYKADVADMEKAVKYQQGVVDRAQESYNITAKQGRLTSEQLAEIYKSVQAEKEKLAIARENLRNKSVTIYTQQLADDARLATLEAEKKYAADLAAIQLRGDIASGDPTKDEEARLKKEKEAAEAKFKTYIEGYKELDTAYEEDETAWAEAQGKKDQSARNAAEGIFEAYQKSFKEGDELNEADLELWQKFQEKKTAAAKKEADKRAEIEKYFWGLAEETAQTTLNLIQGFADTAFANEINAIESKYDYKTQAEQDYADFLAGKERERYNSMSDAEKREYDLAKAAEASRVALEERKAKEIHAVKVKQFKADQALSIIDATIDGIKAGMKSFAQLGWPLGLIPAAVMAGLTAAQIGLISSKEPPQLAEGGIVMPRAGGVPAILAEAGQPEVVFPLEKLERFLGSGSGGSPEGDIRLVVNLDSQPFLDKIFPATRNRTILISAGAVV
jgi:tape measure domain-containing protein